MSTTLYIQCFVACLIGNVLHILFKMRSLSKDYKSAEVPFTLGSYIDMDKWPLLLDAFASFALVYVVDEWLELDDRIIQKIKTIFIFVGFSGSYVILQLTSVAKKRLQKTIGDATEENLKNK